jgi:hypothetical protein
MSSPVRRYTDEINGQFSYWATWFPTSQVQLGDLGPIQSRVFSPQTSLKDLGVSFETTRGTEVLNLQHATQNRVQITFQSAAASQTIPQIPQGKAGVEVVFATTSGIVFVLKDGRERRIRNLDAMGRKLLKLIQRGDVAREYAVVTHVVDVAAVTVLISGSSDAKFIASADIDLKAGLLDLANPSVSFSRVSSKNMETELVADQGATPLFKLAGFKKGGLFWGSPKVAPLGFDTDDDPGELDELELTDTDAEADADDGEPFSRAQQNGR